MGSFVVHPPETRPVRRATRDKRQRRRRVVPDLSYGLPRLYRLAGRESLVLLCFAAQQVRMCYRTRGVPGCPLSEASWERVG